MLGLVGIPQLRLCAKERPADGRDHGDGGADHQRLQAGQVIPAAHGLRRLGNYPPVSVGLTWARVWVRPGATSTAMIVNSRRDVSATAAFGFSTGGGSPFLVTGVSKFRE